MKEHVCIEKKTGNDGGPLTLRSPCIGKTVCVRLRVFCSGLGAGLDGAMEFVGDGCKGDLGGQIS